jgi:hypothetical protein
MIRMGMGDEDQRNFIRRSAYFFQIILEKEACRRNPGIDEADPLSCEKIGIDRSLCILAFTKGQSKRMFNRMNRFSNLQFRSPFFFSIVPNS